NHVHGDHLESLLKFSAGQWNTLVNIGLVLCGLAGQDCIGTNTPAHCSRSSASCGRQELFSEGDQDGHAGRQKSVGLLAAQAVDELLNRAKRSVVFLALLLQKREWDTELCMQSICAVPHDR
ncbi:hypothetical protein, partial [Acidovorax sp. Leaf73]|uniref:hypothetical protein n=1 Tax=Acidovorax sp. Leaf73 TaxID=2876566 RepID=UPI00351D4FD7